MLKRIISNLLLSGSNHSQMMQKASVKLENRNNILAKHKIQLNKELSQANLSSSTKQEIISSSVYQLSDKLKKNQVSSVNILLTYFERAIKYGQQFNLITESNFDEALNQAKQCDEKLKQMTQEQRDQLSPFYGIPVSLKDQIMQKGFDSTLGMIRNANKPDKADGFFLELVKSKGAIPFLRSTMPQIGLLTETVSNLWGVTSNPWNPLRTVGGSSGGEAGLIAAQCSPFGLGSDVGGSIRIPSLYNGTYGLKPTDQRLTYNGYKTPSGKNTNRLIIKACSGPMGTCVEDLNLFMQEMCNDDRMHLNDPQTVPIKWRSEQYSDKGKKRIAYIQSLDYFGASKANRRAVLQAVDALRKKGHDLVEITQLPEFVNSTNNFFSILGSENSIEIVRYLLQGENLHTSYFDNALANTLPFPIKQLAIQALELQGEKRAANILKALGRKSFYEYQRLAILQKIHRNTLNQFYISNKFDAIISPGSALPAYLHNQTPLSLQVFYTAYWNYMNFTTGAMPITKVQNNELFYELNKECIHNDKYFKLAQQCIKESAGMPVGIQISTRPFAEETCLNIMKQIEDEIQFHEHPTLA